jgi:hypothetical protein
MSKSYPIIEVKLNMNSLYLKFLTKKNICEIRKGENMATCTILLAAGLVFTIGGFGGFAVFKMGKLSIAGGAGVVMIIASTLIPC